MNSKPRKRLGLKTLLIFALILGLGLFGMFFFRQGITKFAAEVFLSRILGAKVSMDNFKLNIALGHLNIEGFKIYNPPGFSDNVMLDLPKVTANFDRVLFTTGRLYASYVDINLKKLLLEKDRNGRMNVDSLKISGRPVPIFRVSILDLQINQVIEKDYRYGKPLIKGHDLNIKKTYRNITGIDQLILLMLTDPLKEVGIKGIKIYGFYAILGTPVAIPVAVAVDSMGKGNVHKDLNMPVDRLFDLSLKVLDDLGDIKKHNRSNKTIYASIRGAGVSVVLKEKSNNETKISITAKWLFFPEHEVASGVLYEIMEQAAKSRKISIMELIRRK
ncbi:MAG: hypothetical protein FJZ12_01930 [Candidatus Omnitrophica bacterium]|nr:hypothetical protein [Candidatus Omnitrophota bacterium]